MSPEKNKKSGAAKPFEFNLFLPEFRTDPYPIYQRLRSEDPVHQSFVNGDWIVTRYADVKTVLRDPRVCSHDQPKLIEQKSRYIQKKGKNLHALANTCNKFLVYMNPPDHTRLRSLVGKAFSPVVFEGMRPQIQEIVDEFLGNVRNKGHMDIIADLAGPLPVRVIARMLGVPPNDAQDRLTRWSSVLFRIGNSLMSLGEYEAINTSLQDFQEYFRALISQREKKPQEDLISYLIAARDRSDKLSEEELLATCILLFMTGEETTVNTIGNGMLALLDHPDQMEKLKQEPEIIQTAVEEMLRYDSPIQFAGRIATENLEIGNQTIKRGEKILLCLGAANRDPSQFPAPDRFDITRSDNQHLAFGDGIHYCLAAALARIQAQIAINTLVQQLPNLKLASDKLEWQKNIIFLRGLKSLPVTFTP